MPYKTIWVEPEVFLEHDGVTVYHTYKDDDFEQGANWYWFRLDQEEDDEGKFDIRDVDPLGLLRNHPPQVGGPGWDSATPQERDAILEAWAEWYESGFDEARRAVLRNAIDKACSTIGRTVNDRRRLPRPGAGDGRQNPSRNQGACAPAPGGTASLLPRSSQRAAERAGAFLVGIATLEQLLQSGSQPAGESKHLLATSQTIVYEERQHERR